MASFGLATVAVFSTGGENGTDSKYDYWASSSDRSLPFARRSEPFGRPAPIFKTSRHRAVLERPSYVTRWTRILCISKQQDRWESVVEPGQLPGELHARRAMTTDQPRLWLVIYVWIIGAREHRHGTGNIGRHASVGATSVVEGRARVRRFRRIRSLRISERPAQTAAALAEACGQAASHPRIGDTGEPSPRISEQACMQPVRGAFPPPPLDNQYCSPTCRKASARSR
jgi:hypothetical protein